MVRLTTLEPQSPRNFNQTNFDRDISTTEHSRGGVRNLVPPRTAQEQGNATTRRGTTLAGQLGTGSSERVTISTHNRGANLVRIAGMARWEGRVLSIDDDFFTVELQALEAAPGGLEAEFSLDLLSQDDQNDLATGSVVYVTVRTVTGPSGMPERTSAIRLRRMGKWTESELLDASARARVLSRSLADLAE